MASTGFCAEEPVYQRLVWIFEEKGARLEFCLTFKKTLTLHKDFCKFLNSNLDMPRLKYPPEGKDGHEAYYL
jgi:hypothetical protein